MVFGLSFVAVVVVFVVGAVVVVVVVGKLIYQSSGVSDTYIFFLTFF